MRKCLAYFCVFMLLVSCTVSCSKKGIIPRNKLSKIYVEMLLADQWINSVPESRRHADTTLVYEPILNKYGYTKEDYLRTQEKYMRDPRRYAKIFRQSAEILEKELKALRKEQEAYAEQKNKAALIPTEPLIDMTPFLPYSKSVHRQVDSVVFRRDSLGYLLMEPMTFRDSNLDSLSSIPDSLAAELNKKLE